MCGAAAANNGQVVLGGFTMPSLAAYFPLSGELNKTALDSIGRQHCMGLESTESHLQLWAIFCFSMTCNEIHAIAALSMRQGF